MPFDKSEYNKRYRQENPDSFRRYNEERRLTGYDRARWKEKRDAFFSDKQCGRCGSTSDLELDHVDPTTKIRTVKWVWSKARLEAELAKCQVLCQTCHQVKTKENFDHNTQKLNIDQVREIKELLQKGDLLQREIAEIFGVSRTAITLINTGKHWREIS
jgi:5-methylcytosine-specific restriction endonuclease McrA